MASGTLQIYSESLMRTVTLNIIVPTDKYKTNKKSQLLILLHGIFGNHSDWIQNSKIKSLAEKHNLVVIMPDGENSFYIDNNEKYSCYSTFIGEELVDFARNTFSVSNKREDTFIAGFSMGGYGAIVNALRFNDTFGYVGLFSAALIIDRALASTDEAQFVIERRSYFNSIFGDLSNIKNSYWDYKYMALLNKKSLPQIYIACGNSDILVEENREYRDFLQNNNIKCTYEESEGAHDWDFWRKAIVDFVNWLPTASQKSCVDSGNIGL